MRCGIPASQVQSIEDGHSPRELDVKVKAIAREFNVDRDWLMWGGPLSEPQDPRHPGDAGSNKDDQRIMSPRLLPTELPPLAAQSISRPLDVIHGTSRATLVAVTAPLLYVVKSAS